ncbi:hypothetical protein Tco_0749529 [Tanacetum coccineum]|uniref:Uncharacterized protein n=1 Tax=Tanacetum coccineum TaxID=301880 RepID=A0ABQ4Z284_9ASTR
MDALLSSRTTHCRFNREILCAAWPELSGIKNLKESEGGLSDTQKGTRVLSSITLNKKKSANRNTTNYHLYHALMETFIADEDAMDKEVADKVKDTRESHDVMMMKTDDDDEGPSCGSKPGSPISPLIREQSDAVVNSQCDQCQGHGDWKWSEDDKRRSKDFITAIEKRLQIRRIYRSLESFVGGRIRDIDYRLINRTTWKSSRANIKQALGSFKDGDGDGGYSSSSECQDNNWNAQTRPTLGYDVMKDLIKVSQASQI